MAQIDVNKFRTNDWGVMAGGVVAFLAMFFHAYTVKASYTIGTVHNSTSAGIHGWHFKGLVLGMLLLLVAGAFVFVKAQGLVPLPDLPLGPKLAVLSVAGLGTLVILIRIVTYPSGGSGGFGTGSYSAGAGFGSYLTLLAGIAATVFAALDFRESGEKIPTRAEFTANLPGNLGGGAQTPTTFSQTPPEEAYAPPPSFGTPPPAPGYSQTPPPPAPGYGNTPAPDYGAAPTFDPTPPPASWQNPQPPAED